MHLGPVLTLPDGDHRVAAVEQLPGGTVKSVRRVRLDDGTSVVVYAWPTSHDRWRDTGPDDDEPFRHVTGPAPVLAATRALEQAGVRVPRILRTDDEALVVEDVPGPRLADLPDTAPLPAGLVGELRRMRAAASPRCGRPGVPLDASFADLVHARALRHLAAAAAGVPELAAVAGRLRGELGRRLDGVRPRQGYSLVHGELGPEHVLVAPDGPVLVDVEGLVYADAEWEHAYLRMRLGDRYPPLDPGDLDPARLTLYRLALHLSLVAGPLRLADAPGELGAVMRGIAAHHTARLLEISVRSRS